MARRRMRSPASRSSRQSGVFHCAGPPFGTPDVVDEHVDVAVAGPELLRQGLHLGGIEMVEGAATPSRRGA